jgi:hypothetical protein
MSRCGIRWSCCGVKIVAGSVSRTSIDCFWSSFTVGSCLLLKKYFEGVVGAILIRERPLCVPKTSSALMRWGNRLI